MDTIFIRLNHVSKLDWQHIQMKDKEKKKIYDAERKNNTKKKASIAWVWDYVVWCRDVIARLLRRKCSDIKASRLADGIFLLIFLLSSKISLTDDAIFDYIFFSFNSISHFSWSFAENHRTLLTLSECYVSSPPCLKILLCREFNSRQNKINKKFTLQIIDELPSYFGHKGINFKI